MNGPRRETFRGPWNYRIARVAEFLTPLLAASHRLLARRRSTGPAAWRRVLLLGTDHIGDVMYRTVGLEELKAWLPGCELLMAASRPAADLLAGNPHVSVWPANEPCERRGLGDWTRIIKAARPDAVICYDTVAYARIVAAAALAGCPDCVAYVHRGFSGLVTLPVPLRTPQPFAAYFRDLVEFLTGRKVPSLRPQVFLSDADRHRAREVRDSIGPRPMVVASVTSRQVSHPAIQRRMMDALAELKRRADVSVVILGAAEDEVPARELATQAGLECFFETGTLHIREAVALFELAAVAFCLDSGPRHMANAAGIPVVFCRNMEFLKTEAGSYLASETDIAPDVELISYSGPGEPPLFAVEAAVEALLRHLPRDSSAIPR